MNREATCCRSATSISFACGSLATMRELETLSLKLSPKYDHHEEVKAPPTLSAANLPSKLMCSNAYAFPRWHKLHALIDENTSFVAAHRFQKYRKFPEFEVFEKPPKSLCSHRVAITDIQW